MRLRVLLAALLLTATTLVWAEPRSASGSDKGPVVVLVSGTQGAVNLWHEGTVVRGWVFPGPFTAAVILAGPLDKVDWDGDEALVVDAGSNPPSTARDLLKMSDDPRLLVMNPDGAAQIVKAPEEEKDLDYDAASAATAEE